MRGNPYTPQIIEMCLIVFILIYFSFCVIQIVKFMVSAQCLLDTVVRKSWSKSYCPEKCPILSDLRAKQESRPGDAGRRKARKKGQHKPKWSQLGSPVGPGQGTCLGDGNKQTVSWDQ